MHIWIIGRSTLYMFPNTSSPGRQTGAEWFACLFVCGFGVSFYVNRSDLHRDQPTSASRVRASAATPGKTGSSSDHRGHGGPVPHAAQCVCLT